MLVKATDTTSISNNNMLPLVSHYYD